MPYTEEQLMALKGASDESKRALFDRMSDSEKAELGQAMSDYMSKSQPKAEQPLADWQKKLKNIKLPNGAITQIRPYDQGLWLDQERGLSPDKQPGWYDLAGRKLPDEPKQTMMQKVGDIPVLPSAWLESKIPGLGWLPNPTVANVAQGAKRTWEKMGQLIQAANLDQPLGSGTNAAQMMAKAPRPEEVQALKDAIARDEQAYAQNYKPDILGESVGSMLAAPIPAGRAATLVGRLGSATARGALQGAISRPVTGDQSVLGDTAKEAAIGAGMGLLGEGVLEGAGYGIRKGAERLRNLLDRAQAVREATGATPTLGDVSKSPLLKMGEKFAEVVPFGGMPGKRLQQAREMAGKLESLTGGEAGTAEDVAASVKRSLAQKKLKYGEPYKFVEQMIDEGGSADVSPLLNRIDESIAGIKTPNTSKGTIDALNTFKQDVERFATGENGPVTFQAMKDLRGKLGEKGAEFQRAGDNETARIFFGLKRDMNGVIEDAAMKADPYGMTLSTLKQADKDWSKHVARFDPNQSEAPAYAVKMLKDLRQPGFEQDAVSKIMNTTSKNAQQFLSEALDEPGKAALRKQILDDITSASTSGKTGMSPLKFADAVKKKEPWVKSLFDQEKADQLMGFANLAKTMERAGQVLEQPSTGWGGMQAETIKSGAAAGLGSVVGFGKVASGIAGTRLYLALTATKQGQNLLRKMSMAGDPSSKYAMNLIKSELPRALSAAKASGNFHELNENEVQE